MRSRLRAVSYRYFLDLVENQIEKTWEIVKTELVEENYQFRQKFSKGALLQENLFWEGFKV